MPYTDRDKLKRQLRIKGDQQDVELQDHVDGAERIMRYLIGPTPVETVTAERIRAYRSGSVILSVRPVVSVTSITNLYGSTVDVSGVEILDADAGVVAMLYGRFNGRYRFTYTAGRAAVDIKANQTLAANIIAQHLWRLRNGGGGAPYPNEQDDIVPLGLGYAVPRRALELLGMESTPIKVPGIA